MNNQSPNLYYLPHKIASAVQQHINSCQNLALVLDKYVERIVIDGPRQRGDKQKGEWLRERLQSNMLDKQLAQNVYQRWLRMMDSLKANSFELALDWRMVVGLGGESVLETDITLHHLYGLPFIPGSALKGLTRAYVTGEEKDYFVPVEKPETERKPSLKEETDHPDIQRIFGTQKQAGTVLFFDAVPKNGEAAFVVDIMNPHYPDYYRTLQSNTITPPTNNQSPNPIAFLAVKDDTIFAFAVAPRDPNNPEHGNHVELVRGWLQKALQKYGVGGKTSAGYGYFKKEMPSVEPQQLEMAQESLAQPQIPSTSIERIRPKIPQFREGQEITGSVVAISDDIRRVVLPEAQAFLRYQSFATKDVLMVVNAQEAQNWKPGETRICLFLREEVRDGCTVLICQPRLKKGKDKK